MNDQKYFHTKEWQKKEAEADEDLRRGDVYGPFETAEDAMKALKAKKSLNKTWKKMKGLDKKETNQAIQEAIPSVRGSKAKANNPTKPKNLDKRFGNVMIIT